MAPTRKFMRAGWPPEAGPHATVATLSRHRLTSLKT